MTEEWRPIETIESLRARVAELEARVDKYERYKDDTGEWLKTLTPGMVSGHMRLDGMWQELVANNTVLKSRVAELEARLREYEGCEHCRTDHPPETMCVPHECRPGLTMQDKLVYRNTHLREQIRRLREALEDLIKAYINLMQKGRDSIIDYRGHCDSVEKMKRCDPDLRNARRALAGHIADANSPE